MNLVLDLGNSRLKWALEVDGALHVGDALPWSETDVGAVLRDCWAGMTPQRVLAADVAGGERRNSVSAAAAACFDTPIEWLRSPAAHGGLDNAYGEPGQLGIDRFTALLAAHVEGRAPCVIAHCGSALVLDALAPSGQHLGGLIAPGIAGMRAGLAASAPGLPPAQAQAAPNHGFATNAQAAVDSGAWQMLAGAIEHFYRQVAVTQSGQTALLLTGGDARVACELIGPPAMLFEHAVLRGLAAWNRAA